MKYKAIHLKDALISLASGSPSNLKCWKISTGDIIEYKDVKCIGSFRHAGIHRIKLPNGQIREFRNITLFEFNGMEVFL